MALTFNYAGPCIPGEHYMVPPETRFGRVMELVGEGKYFTLHAGRQMGKTTSLQWLVDLYNRGEHFCALWVDIQTAREQPDVARAMRTVIGTLEWWREISTPALAALDIEALLKDPTTALTHALSQLAASAPRPLVVMIDEADGLVGEAMVSFLTQLRAGYISRHKLPFPHSVALVGMRQVRDYTLTTDDRRAVSWLGTTSPFNITAEAATMRPFLREEVVELLEQHTSATGQAFTEEAIERISVPFARPPLVSQRASRTSGLPRRQEPKRGRNSSARGSGKRDRYRGTPHEHRFAGGTPARTSRPEDPFPHAGGRRDTDGYSRR